MATCPNCGEEMEATEVMCPHCGYDFPLQERERRRRGVAYSALGDLALSIGMACTALSVVGMLIFVGLALVELNFRLAFFCLIVCFILLALYVVFQRVADMD